MCKEDARKRGNRSIQLRVEENFGPSHAGETTDWLSGLKISQDIELRQSLKFDLMDQRDSIDQKFVPGSVGTAEVPILAAERRPSARANDRAIWVYISGTRLVCSCYWRVVGERNQT